MDESNLAYNGCDMNELDTIKMLSTGIFGLFIIVLTYDN